MNRFLFFFLDCLLAFLIAKQYNVNTIIDLLAQGVVNILFPGETEKTEVLAVCLPKTPGLENSFPSFHAFHAYNPSFGCRDVGHTAGNDPV